MRYTSGYKYQLTNSIALRIDGIALNTGVSNQFSTLFPNGDLVIFSGYAWDGCTGILDTKKNMEAGLVHDALYQLCRGGQLSFSAYKIADQAFADICIKNGTPRWLARLYHWGLKKMGGKYAMKSNRRKVHEVYR